MKHQNDKNRIALRNKMAEVFNDRINNLPADMQYILLDDLVTAFENRMEILNQTQPTLETFVAIGVKASV